MTLAMIDPRTAARHWIASTLRTHLAPELHVVGGPDRIGEVAALVEAAAFAQGMRVELAVEIAAEWCDMQNERIGLSQKGYFVRQRR